MKDEVTKFKGTLTYTTRTGFKSKAEYGAADCMVWDMLNLLTDDDLRTVVDAVAAQRKVRKGTNASLEEVGP